MESTASAAMRADAGSYTPHGPSQCADASRAGETCSSCSRMRSNKATSLCRNWLRKGEARMHEVSLASLGRHGLPAGASGEPPDAVGHGDDEQGGREQASARPANTQGDDDRRHGQTQEEVRKPDNKERLQER